MSRIAQLEELLKQEPNDSFLQHALALEHIKIGNDAEAEELFTTLLKRNPGYVGSYYHLAKLLTRANKTQEAIKIYEAGMMQAKLAGDMHSHNELQGEYDDLID
jgi:predicted Zn-dependent protease